MLGSNYTGIEYFNWHQSSAWRGVIGGVWRRATYTEFKAYSDRHYYPVWTTKARDEEMGTVANIAGQGFAPFYFANLSSYNPIVGKGYADIEIYEDISSVGDCYLSIFSTAKPSSVLLNGTAVQLTSSAPNEFIFAVDKNDIISGMNRVEVAGASTPVLDACIKIGRGS